MMLSSRPVVAASIAAVLSASLASVAGAAINWQLSAPGTTQSAYQGMTGTQTLTFTPGDFSELNGAGTVSYNSGGIYNAGEWGGAGGSGKYYSTNFGGSLDLHVTQLAYLGFYWSSMGSGDTLEIHRQRHSDWGWEQVFTINYDTVANMIGAGTAPTTDGVQRSLGAYDTHGQYGTRTVYMNIFLPQVADTWQYSVVFKGVNSTMEIDNITVSSAAVPAPGAIALIGAAGLVGRRRKA